MAPENRTAANARLFAQVAPGYDGLSFLTLAARDFALRLEVAPRARVLDVATGTGTVALALAPRAGEVIGTDLVPEMVQLAGHKAEGIGNLTFQVADGAALPFPDASFDLVVCGAGLFFFPDMARALREWGRVLRPGGRVAFSAFGRGLLGPLPGLWRERLATVGVRAGAPPLGRLPTPEAALALLQDGGWEEARANLFTLSHTVPDVERRWAEIAAGLEGAGLAELSAPTRAKLEAEHRAELAPLFAAGPLTVPLPLIVAQGRKTGGG